MKRRITLTLAWVGLALIATTNAKAQTQPEAPQVVQVSGLVVTGDSLSPLPYCTVFRSRDRRGTMTDVRGFFSLPALEGDTLEFSSVGYVTHRAII
ncbi:MAG: carboxypeptidase-like regulatory domain-containing protein, partial [Flavobacteriales bacterium]|nr:carboxypeptidase-like regulatory domain-containing protein [Flavobacteriales bacterium]